MGSSDSLSDSREMVELVTSKLSDEFRLSLRAVVLALPRPLVVPPLPPRLPLPNLHSVFAKKGTKLLHKLVA